jgi:thiamine pyrophosphate-dependent acetolactate synthase large subunit-like protein
VAQSKAHWEKLLAGQEDPARSADLVHPQAVAGTLARLATDDAIFTCDTGEVTVWGARHLHLRAGQRFTLSFNLASMAYALPAALGAQLTWPQRQVIALSGDGGFNMLMGDFLTAVKYALPIKVIVFNNGKLGLIQMEEEAEGLPEEETLLQNPDYVALALAMGGKGFRINRPDEIEAVLQLALAEPGPVIVDAVINPKEITWPPRIELGQAMGFGIAKVKELFSV